MDVCGRFGWAPWESVADAASLLGNHGSAQDGPLGGMTTVPVAVVHVGDLGDLCIGADSRSETGLCQGREMEEGEKASELRDVMQTEGRGAKPANQEMSNDGARVA